MAPVSGPAKTSYHLNGYDSKTRTFLIFPPDADYPAYLTTPIYVATMAKKAMTRARIDAASELCLPEIEAKLRALLEYYEIDEKDIDAGFKLALALAGAHVPGMKLEFRKAPKNGKGPIASANHRADAQWYYVQETKAKEGFRHNIQAIRYLMKTDHPLFRRQTEDVIAQRVKEAKGRATIEASARAAETASFHEHVARLMEQPRSSIPRRSKPRKGTE